MKLSSESVEKIQIYLSLFLVFLFPLSRGGMPYSRYDIAAGILLLFAVFVYMVLNRINSQKFLLSFILFFYLLIATILTLSRINSGFRFGYMRFVYTITLLFLFSTISKHKLSFDFYEKLLNILFAFVVIGNLAMWLNIANINAFIIDVYTQYRDFITSYQLEMRKPILVFGVHNIAAFIYQGLFIISFFSYRYTKKKRYYFYSIIYIILLLVLRCTTSIGFSIFSIGVLVYDQTKSLKKLSVAIVILIIAVIVAFNNGLIDLYYDILSQQSNGILPRYISGANNLFGGNFQVIKESLLGTGYCISDGTTNVYGADSGYIITLMMGKYLYFILFYWFLWNFLKKNLVKKEYIIIVFAYLMMMELGFVTFLYFRSIAFFFFIVQYLSALNNETRIKKCGVEHVK